MIIEYLIKIFLILTIVIVLQTTYSTLVYRQVGWARWLKFSAIGLVTLAIGIVLIMRVKWLVQLPYLQGVVQFIDKVIFAFFGYLSGKLLFVWFIVPLLLMWVVYLGKSIYAVTTNRMKFNRWKKENTEKEKPAEVMSSADDQTDDIQDEDIVVEEQELADPKDVIEPETAVAEDVHFLTDVPLTRIRFNSALGIQRAYEIAKNKGLQVGETATGYVAVYSDAKGIKQLKEILKTNHVKEVKLENRPSIVMFDRAGASCTTIKQAMAKIKAGESIG